MLRLILVLAIIASIIVQVGSYGDVNTALAGNELGNLIYHLGMMAVLGLFQIFLITVWILAEFIEFNGKIKFVEGRSLDE